MGYSENKHSPTPWKVDNHISIVARVSEKAIATMYPHTNLSPSESYNAMVANADLIVQAVNSHEALVEALEAILKITTGEDEDYQLDGIHSDDARYNYPAQQGRITELARQALATAKGEQPC